MGTCMNMFTIGNYSGVLWSDLLALVDPVQPATVCHLGALRHEAWAASGDTLVGFGLKVRVRGLTICDGQSRIKETPDGGRR